MKKLLGVSIAAMLAVTPMLANATNPASATTESTPYAGVSDTASNNIATTSYVAGAYNAVVGMANDLASKKQDKLYTGSGNNTASISANVATTVRAATGDNAADDATLVTEKAVRTAIAGAITAAGGQTAQEVQTAIENAAGSGLAVANGDLNVDVDGTTIEVDSTSHKVQVVAGGINTTQLADDAVKTAKIEAKAVTTAKIGDKAVTAAQIADNTITASQIANATITSTQLAADSVTSTQIADGAVGLAKIASGDKQNATDTTTYTNTKLANAAYVDETVATAVANKATKSGVTETINQSTVTVYTTWGNLSNTQTVSLNGHAYAEPAPAQQTEP